MINSPYKIILIGLGAGFIAGLLGLGGGIIMVPAAVFLLGLNQHQAHGISLLVIAPTALVGSLIYAAHGNLNLTYVFYLCLGSFLGAFLGSHFANKISAKNLAILYSILSFIIGIKLVWS